MFSRIHREKVIYNIKNKKEDKTMKLNSKKVLRIVAIILLVMLAFTIVQPVFAGTGTMVTPKNLEGKISYGESTDLQTKAGKIMGLIRNVAVIVGVIMLMVIGVKFMLGSAEEKADYKKSLMPLVVGIVIVMAATQIAAMVVSFMQ